MLYMETTPHIGSQITITPELASAAGRIALKHSDSGLRIEYREDDPLNIWHVIAVDDDKEYAVNDETGEIHAIDCDLDDDCMCQPAPPAKPAKLTKPQREALERCVRNNGWALSIGSAAQSMARKLESYGYVTINEGSGNIHITQAGRDAIS